MVLQQQHAAMLRIPETLDMPLFRRALSKIIYDLKVALHILIRFFEDALSIRANASATRICAVGFAHAQVVELLTFVGIAWPVLARLKNMVTLRINLE